MRDRLVPIIAIPLAIIGWWGILELTGQVNPADPGALTFFYALLFLAVTATLAPPAAYLNRRFAPQAAERDPLRFLRHSAWAGLCVASWAWLQMRRVFNPAFALIIILIFVVIEVLVARTRSEA